MDTEREPFISDGVAERQDLPSSKAGRIEQLGPLEISRSTRYLILAGIWSATFLSVNVLTFRSLKFIVLHFETKSLNTTLVATLLPSISSDFNKSNQASWLGTSYLLATCTFTPLYGRLSNVLGRRGANQVAVISAALGTLACGFSTNMEILIAARFRRKLLAGLGGGGINTTATIITSDMYSIRARGLAQGVSNVFNGLGMGLGGPVGGLVSDWFGWRWAFLMQMPLFMISLLLTTLNLHYVTPGKSKSIKEVIRRIDYLGSLTLLIAVASILLFLSTKYNEQEPWDSLWVILPLVSACIFSIAFVVVELFVSLEPMLAPSLLKQKIPVLVGISNFLVATCNFSVMYFFPMWFQTVALTSTATAGLHLLPNSISMSIGSLFAGWMMHRTGRYKTLNLILGICPFIGALLITFMHEDSGPLQMWLSIIPLGFGNAVVLQTMLIALLAHLPLSVMAVGTGFGQLFRGIGQVGGVAISSAVFQSRLDYELRQRIHTPDADQLIDQIRHSARLVASLPPDLQRAARDSYAIGLKTVFTLAACSTLLAYIVRIPIPEKILEHQPRKQPDDSEGRQSADASRSDLNMLDGEEPEDDTDDDSPTPHVRRQRRLSTYQPTDGTVDLESDTAGGSARQPL